ncbi:hypothetical protein JCM12296A_33000 [Desulfosarcina cetonica]|uniref:DUF4405 domain-containing protein n=1 Tax=Desulfosarcina cetonica TaxID=90730 RepID=UPI0006D07B4C|nr:DUF4405 domain-containing protein [Desulfosarcina cetonica]
MDDPKKINRWTINIIAFGFLVILAGTGLINWLILPHGLGRQAGALAQVRHFLMNLHAWAGVLFIATLALHLKLHWTYIRANLIKSGVLKK